MQQCEHVQQIKTRTPRAQGCEAIRIEDHADLLARLDEVLAGLALRDTPLVLEIAVEP